MIFSQDNYFLFYLVIFGKDRNFHDESTNERNGVRKIERLFQYDQGERNMASAPTTKVRQRLFHFRKWHINIAAGCRRRVDNGYGEQPGLTNRIEV